MDKIETKNAKIASTTLGYEDHGVFTFYLGLDYGGSGQSAGGYALDEYDRIKETRKGYPHAIDLLSGILNIVGVDSWEEIKGQHIRVRASYGKVYAIGNFLKDEWLDFQEFFADHKEAT